MTDYLEALLEEQEREREDVLGVCLAADWPFYRRRRAAAETEEGAPAQNGGFLAEPGSAADGEEDPSEDGGRWSEEWVLEPLAERGAQGGTLAPDGGGKGPESRRETGGAARLDGKEAVEPESSTVRPVYPELEGEAFPAWRAEGAAPELERRAVLPAWLTGEGAPERRWTAGTGTRQSRAEQEGAGWLYQSLRAGDAAAGFALRSGGTVTVVERPGDGAADGLTPAELDRTLERDARRYDGGFSLF